MWTINSRRVATRASQRSLMDKLECRCFYCVVPASHANAIVGALDRG